MKIINLINYYDFNQSEISKELEDEFGWKPYPRKHGESTFTTFYQNYILPTKFNIADCSFNYCELCASALDRLFTQKCEKQSAPFKFHEQYIVTSGSTITK